MTHDPFLRATLLRAVLIDGGELPDRRHPPRLDPFLRALLLRVVPILSLGLLGLIVA